LRGEPAPAFVFAPELPGAGGTGWLEGEERHHLVNVCRAKPGDLADATDGRGRLARIRLTALDRRAAFEVEALEVVAPGPRAVLACGAPEGARSDWLIEKLAELGIAALQPLDTERASWRWSEARGARAARLTLAALKQSRRAHRMEVETPLPLGAWLERLGPVKTRWLADARGGAPSAPAVGSFAGVAGPAQGFSARERSTLLDAGFVPVRFGAGTLRAETAGLSLAALWSAFHEGQGDREDRAP
jgi:16S rRNA (uracil1498-N3)-methyltransferase